MSMGKRKPKEPAIRTNPGDLLFQNNLKCEDVAGQDAMVAELQQEKRVLEDRTRAIEEQCGTFLRSKKTLLEEVNRLDARVKELQEEKTSLVSVLFNRAIQELKHGKCIYALGLLQTVLAHEPENLKAMINLAVVYAELGERDMAIETLQGVLAKDPDNEIALRHLSILSDE
ncbi:MAG: tetratricopeptide repeat protein [Syntrophobacteraceae bacterium]